MARAGDRYRFILDRPTVAEPGTRWAYNTGATLILGRLIAHGTGKPLETYVRDMLFDPIGIADAEWVAGSDRVAAAGGGLRMRPRDVAKLGQLILNRGRWGRQAVGTSSMAR